MKPLVTDFFSFTRQLTQCVSKKFQLHDKVYEGRVNYYGCTVNSIKNVLAHCLWHSKEDGHCDVTTIPLLNSTNPLIISELACVVGDHLTYYHFFNWNTVGLNTNQMSVNLLQTI